MSLYDFNTIPLFYNNCKTKSFNQAAQQFFVSQPSLTNSMKDLPQKLLDQQIARICKKNVWQNQKKLQNLLPF